MEDLTLLHVGCANKYHEGFVNSDSRTGWEGKEYKLDEILDLSKPWHYEDDSVDGIVGMHVFQQLTWRELMVAFSEAYRVLKKGCALRIGCPTADMTDRALGWLLGWNNINLFNKEILEQVLVGHVGFSDFRECQYQGSSSKELAKVDNRPHRSTKYFEAIK